MASFSQTCDDMTLLTSPVRRPGRGTRHRVGLVVLVAGLCGLAPATGHAAQDTPPTTVARVDLDRYVGTWFELARFPNRFQRQCVGEVTATYRARPDGRLDVVNRCRVQGGQVDEAVGVARSVSPGSDAKLKVRFAPAFLSFLPMVWGDYWIVDLADDYSTVVVGSPDRQYLWLLARTPGVAEPVYQRLLDAASREGYDVDRLVRTPQD
jgi:apolipoprotein D and lipocalin family protein